MNVKFLSREEAGIIFDLYVQNGSVDDSQISKLDQDYKYLRNELLSIESKYFLKHGYEKDLGIALDLFDYLSKSKWFNETVATNIGFWRYLSLCVVPDLVERRHGLNPEYFYSKGVRIYLYAMWMYIFMSFQGTMEKTEHVLKGFSTDYILNFVERQGKSDGFYPEIFREIIRVLSLLPPKIRNNKVRDATLYRRVLIQNTAKTDNFNLLIEGKTRDYVKMLFKSCKQEIDEYE